MLPADREEFDSHLRALCAGFNVPVGDRSDAYWRGLAKMPLPTFIRVVEHALAADGPEKIPTTHQCWGISKQLRARPVVYEHEKPEESNWHGDAWDRSANHHFAKYIDHAVNSSAAGRYGRSFYRGAGMPIEFDRAMQERVAILLEAKNAWALEMREGGDAERDPANQLRCWKDLFTHAEKRIDEHIAQCNQQAAA